MPAVPVLVLTDRPDEVASELVASRSIALMLKPIAPAVLASLVRTICQTVNVGYQKADAKPRFVDRLQKRSATA